MPSDVCEVRGWPVFQNGYHKGELFTPDHVRRIAENFARLKGHLTPTLRLGHDTERRLEQSLGLPNAGRIADARVNDRGQLVIDVTGVPTWLGAQINAGRYQSGSIEVKHQVPDPADPSKLIPGHVLDGVALLGEEQPAVKGLPAPRAVFADGTPVPPDAGPVPVPAAVAGRSAFAARSPVLAFSDPPSSQPPKVPPMTALANSAPRPLPPAAVRLLSHTDAGRQTLAKLRERAAGRTTFSDGEPPSPAEVQQTYSTRAACLRQLQTAHNMDIFDDAILAMDLPTLQAKVAELDAAKFGAAVEAAKPAAADGGSRFADTPPEVAELARQLNALPANQRAKVLATFGGGRKVFSADATGVAARRANAERLLSHTDLGRQTLAKMRERAAAAK